MAWRSPDAASVGTMINAERVVVLDFILVDERKVDGMDDVEM